MKEYIEFQDVGFSASRKTKKWHVVNKRNGAWLAIICWSGPWRKYVFLPRPNTVWDAACLIRVAEFCTERTYLHKKEEA